MIRRPSIHLCERYLPLVAKKARQEWYRLPPQTRAWVSLEDLIQDGMMHLVQTLLPKYNKKKCQLLTYLWFGLENFFKNKNYYHFAKRRFDGRSLPLRECALSVPEENTAPKELVALDALYRILRAASPELRLEMVRWLLRPTPTKFHRHGQQFKTLRREVLALSPSTGFGHEEMHYLMTTETWKMRAARQVYRVANVPC